MCFTSCLFSCWGGMCAVYKENLRVSRAPDVCERCLCHGWVVWELGVKRGSAPSGLTLPQVLAAPGHLPRFWKSVRHRRGLAQCPALQGVCVNAVHQILYIFRCHSGVCREARGWQAVEWPREGWRSSFDLSSIWPLDICSPASIWSYILSCAETVWYFMTRKKKKRIQTAVFLPCSVQFAIYLIFTRIKYKVLVLISCLFRKLSVSVFSASLLCVCDSSIWLTGSALSS